MKIELASIVCSKQDVPWLDYSLESILDNTKNDISTTIFLARYDDQIFDSLVKVVDKYGVKLEVRGDNYPIGYVNETKHKGFDVNNADCVISIHPDVVFFDKNNFDESIDEASQNFDENYAVYVSSDNPEDVQPMGITIHTKLGWDKIGCEDCNFYPQCGVEHDYHRRCYLAYGLDPEDTKKYLAPIRGELAPDWIYRVKAKHLHHLNKNWNYNDSRIREGLRYGFDYHPLNYALYVFGDKCVINQSHTAYHANKWGGGLGRENFLTPFNDPKFTMRISPKDMHKPYPGWPVSNLRGMIV